MKGKRDFIEMKERDLIILRWDLQESTWKYPEVHNMKSYEGQERLYIKERKRFNHFVKSSGRQAKK